MAPLDQVDHFINTVYTDPRFRPPRPESTPVAPGGPSTPQGDKQRCDREVAVDMLPCCRRGAGVAGAARRDHDGYSDTPGRPVLPDGGTLPRLAHAEKNSETACTAESPTSRSV